MFQLFYNYLIAAMKMGILQERNLKTKKDFWMNIVERFHYIYT